MRGSFIMCGGWIGTFAGGWDGWVGSEAALGGVIGGGAWRWAGEGGGLVVDWGGALEVRSSSFTSAWWDVVIT